jgi:hypothetical protein
LTADIRRDCIAGFAAHGLDGKGKFGFRGYMQFLATKHPKAAARLIEKILPFVVNGSGFNPAPVSTIRIVGIESGEYLSREDIDRLQQQPQLFNHVPAIEHHNAPAPEIEAKPEPRLAALEAELNNLSYDELLARARQCGLVDNVE